MEKTHLLFKVWKNDSVEIEKRQLFKVIQENDCLKNEWNVAYDSS